jgi:hypothetical protein
MTDFCIRRRSAYTKIMVRETRKARRKVNANRRSPYVPAIARRPRGDSRD